MSVELIDSLKAISKFRVIPPSKNVMAHASYNDGFHTDRSITKPSITDALSLTEFEEVFFIKSVQIVLPVVGLDIKLISIDAYGDECKHNANRREQKGDKELLQFDIQDPVYQIVLSCSGDIKGLSIQAIRIVGLEIRKITDSLETVNNLWEKFDGESKEVSTILEEEYFEKKKDILKLDTKIESLSHKKEQLDNQYELTNTQLDEVRSYLEDSKQQLEVNNTSVAQLATEKEKHVASLKQLDIDIKNRNKSIDSAETKIEELTSKIKDYKEEASLYSEDFLTYKKEVVKQNLTIFVLLSLLFIFGGYFIFKIHESALYISSDFQFNLDIWSLFVSRLPFITINVFIISIVSSLVYMLLNLLIQNYKDVSAIQRIVYLIKETSDSQSKDLSLSDEELLKARMNGKMILIREYLSSGFNTNTTKLRFSKNSLSKLNESKEKN